jgi:hypothetical protein
MKWGPTSPYTDLGATPPGTTATLTVPTGVEACELQVDPVNA